MPFWRVTSLNKRFFFFLIFFLASCFFKHSLVAREAPLLERPTPTWRPLPTCIGVGAGNFLEVRRKFARILPNLPEKYFNVRDLQNVIAKIKSCHVNSGAFIYMSKHVGRHCYSDFQGIAEGSQRFCLGF